MQEAVTAIVFFSVIFGAGFYSGWLVRSERHRRSRSLDPSALRQAGEGNREDRKERSGVLDTQHRWERLCTALRPKRQPTSGLFSENALAARPHASTAARRRQESPPIPVDQTHARSRDT